MFVYIRESAKQFDYWDDSVSQNAAIHRDCVNAAI